jgi:hypothetical protein
MTTTERRKGYRSPHLRPAPGTAAVGRARWVGWLLPAAALLLVAVMSLHPIGAYDLWWQLKTGELIWNRHSIPRADVFSHTALGQPWHVQEWLAELVFFALYRAFSPNALVAYKLVGSTLVFALVLWRCWLRSRMTGLAALVTMLAAYAARPSFDMRPQLFSYLFLALALLCLDQWRQGVHARLAVARSHWRGVWALPLITLLWVNFHGAFMVMFAVLAVEIAAEVWERLAGGGAPGRIVSLLLVTALCGLAGVINPNGAESYRYAFLLLGRNDMLDQVMEWASPNFHDAMEKPLIYLLLLVPLAGALVRRSSARDLLLTAGFLHSTLFSKRHVPLMAIACAPIVAGLLAEAARDLRHWMTGRRWSYEGCRTAAAIGLGLLLSARIAAHAWEIHAPVLPDPPSGSAPATGWFPRFAQVSLFPDRACDFLMAQPRGGRLFNDYGWGGYCIWRLWPKYRVFIDGRAEVYFKTSYTDYLKIVDAEPGWEERLRRWDVDTILVDATTLLAATLTGKPGWRQVYEDEQAVIYQRVKPATGAAHAPRGASG